MSITRSGITDGANGRPIISGMVVRDDTVYLCGITAADALQCPLVPRSCFRARLSASVSGHEAGLRPHR